MHWDSKSPLAHDNLARASEVEHPVGEENKLPVDTESSLADALDGQEVSLEHNSANQSCITKTDTGSQDGVPDRDESESVASDSEPEDDSSGDSSDSSSSSAEDNETMTDAQRQIFLSYVDDEVDRNEAGDAVVQSRNEQPERVIDAPDIEILPATAISNLGTVETISDRTVIIKSEAITPDQVADEESLVVFEDRRILGVIADTFGPVKQPFYCIRYHTVEQLEATGVKESQRVYVVPELSHFVETIPLKLIKGSDASNLHDEEIADNEMEFSDDEKELEYKRRQKKIKTERRQTRNSETNRVATGPYKTDTSSVTEYSPLTRPSDFESANRGIVDGSNRNSQASYMGSGANGGNFIDSVNENRGIDANYGPTMSNGINLNMGMSPGPLPYQASQSFPMQNFFHNAPYPPPTYPFGYPYGYLAHPQQIQQQSGPMNGPLRPIYSPITSFGNTNGIPQRHSSPHTQHPPNTYNPSSRNPQN